jgi:hypothetical protein
MGISRMERLRIWLFLKIIKTLPFLKSSSPKTVKKFTVSPSVIDLNRNRIILKSEKTPFLPYDEKDFYLNEDLLDKQVIDIDGKRLVRVNDILLENNGDTKVIGIDIGFSGLSEGLALVLSSDAKPKFYPGK